MKKLIEMITHNFGWKVLSLAAAILVWFLIVNITNPTRDQSVSVMLRVAGEDVLRENNIVLFNADEIASSIIHLTLRGSYTSLMQAEQDRQNGTLYAFIDLSPIDISRSSDFGSRLPIRVRAATSSQNYEILGSSPSEVDVILDRFVTRSFPITVEKADEDLQGYITSEPIASPPDVTIRGPSSVIDMIAEVRATVEVGTASESFDTRRPIEVLNVDGRDISSRLELSVSDVNVFVNVGTFARIPVSAPVITGNAAEGYRITNVSVSPREIEVEGHSSDIRELNAIRLMPVYVGGMNRTRVETYDIRAYLEGTNLSIREGSEGRVRVTVTVEQEITKEIVIHADQIEIRGAAGDATLPYDGEVIRLEVQGLASEIVEFEASQLIAFVDVSGLEPGTHLLEVQLQTPDGIKQTGTEAVEVVVGEPEGGEPPGEVERVE